MLAPPVISALLRACILVMAQRFKTQNPSFQAQNPFQKEAKPFSKPKLNLPPIISSPHPALPRNENMSTKKPLLDKFKPRAYYRKFTLRVFYCLLESQGWRKGVSTSLPPTWPECDSWSRHLMWVEFVVSSRPGSSGFSSLLKIQHLQIPIPCAIRGPKVYQLTGV